MQGRVALLACALSGAVAAEAQKPFIHNDTTFLVRDFRAGYHAVFIAPQADSAWRQRVASPPGDMLQHTHVRKQQRMLAELGIRPTATATASGQGPADYVGVVLHEGRFCLYAPGDWANHRQLQLNGAWLITNETDGPLAHAIVERLEPANGELRHLRCISMVSHALDPKADRVDVRAWRIDEATGVELWEHTDSYGEARYELMVPLDRADALPVIVNHAPGRRAQEMRFEAAGPHLVRR